MRDNRYTFTIDFAGTVKEFISLEGFEASLLNVSSSSILPNRRLAVHCLGVVKTAHLAPTGAGVFACIDGNGYRKVLGVPIPNIPKVMDFMTAHKFDGTPLGSEWIIALKQAQTAFSEIEPNG